MTDAQRLSLLQSFATVDPSVFDGWREQGTLTELKRRIDPKLSTTEGIRSFRRKSKKFHELLVQIPQACDMPEYGKSLKMKGDHSPSGSEEPEYVLFYFDEASFIRVTAHLASLAVHLLIAAETIRALEESGS